MLKRTVANSVLQNLDKKKNTSKSASKTLVKTLKENKVPVSEIVSVTRHNNETGFVAYEREEQH